LVPCVIEVREMAVLRAAPRAHRDASLVTVHSVTQGDEAVHRFRQGAVAITGASGQVGTALRQRLEELPNEVRSLGPGNDLEAALRDADAVVHLAGTLFPHKPNTYRAANLDTVLATTAALAGSQAQRVVFLSFLGSHLDADNAYLRYKAEAEQLLRSAPTPAVIFQCDHIYGPPTEPGPTASAFLAKSGTVRLLGAGTQQLAPLSEATLWKRSSRPRSIPRRRPERLSSPGPTP
jgi:hypothetical protein